MVEKGLAEVRTELFSINGANSIERGDWGVDCAGVVDIRIYEQGK